MDRNVTYQTQPGDNASAFDDFTAPDRETMEKLKAFRTSLPVPDPCDDEDTDEILERLNGLRWDLVDAQMDANRLSRMYLELCEMAAPWMGDIQTRRKQSVRFSRTKNEASMYRYQLRDTPRVRQDHPQTFSKNVVDWGTVYPAPSAGGSIAVHLHLYYVDLTDEFVRFFQNIPFPFDLYISCRQDANPEAICKSFSVLEMAQSIIVRKTQNRGRDIAPLYVLFREEVAKHDYFLHVHSKKSLHAGSEQVEWRTGALRALCGSDIQVRKIFGVLCSSRNIGLLFPETVSTLHFLAHSWMQNDHWFRKLAKEYDFSTDESILNFPVGSFFWAKTEALRPLFDRNYTYEDFEAEGGQLDGTLAHALERAVSSLARSRGYSLAIVDPKDDVVRFDFSDKLLETYYSQTLSSLKESIAHFDAICFEVFGTLLTSKLYDPAHLFHLMETQMKLRYGIHVDYPKCRREAECRARRTHGDATNIHHIYAELPVVMDISEQIANELKELEIALEYECAIPRQDMLDLFRYLRRKQVPVYLTCDSELPDEILSGILKKCGYEDYSELYVSCDLGMRKDDGRMWAFLRQKWNGMDVAHICDDLCSDMKTPQKNRLPIFPVLNPRTLFQLSPLYPQLSRSIRPDAASSYELGMLVNGCLFNSPFALEDRDHLRPLSYDAAAKAIFAPALLSFVQAASRYAEDDQLLLFSAQNGAFLHQLYEYIRKNPDRRAAPSALLHVSTRAASVAAVQSRDDIVQILKASFTGSLGELLNDKLGISVPEYFYLLPVSTPAQESDVLALLEPHIPAILEQAEQERRNYQSYLRPLLSGVSKPPVFVGFGPDCAPSYCLSQIAGRRVNGFYFISSPENDPLHLHCTFGSLFSDQRDPFGETAVEYAPFLKLVLPTEEDRLVCFDEDAASETGVRPRWQHGQIPQAEVRTMQQSIADYAAEFTAFESAVGHPVDLDPELAVRICAALLDGEFLPEEIRSLFPEH